MPRFAKGSEEAKKWAAEMRERRNAKRAGKGLDSIKEKVETEAEIRAKSDKAYAKRKAAKAAPEKKEEKKEEKPAAPGMMMYFKKKSEPKGKLKHREFLKAEEAKLSAGAVKKVQEEAKKKAADEGMKIAPPPAAAVKKIAEMSLKELRAKVRDLRKIVCPPASRMNKAALMTELARLSHAEGESEGKMNPEHEGSGYLSELRAEVRKLRRKHCPPVTKMNKARLVVEATALEPMAKKMEHMPTAAEVSEKAKKEREETKKTIAEQKEEAKKLPVDEKTAKRRAALEKARAKRAENAKKRKEELEAEIRRKEEEERKRKEAEEAEAKKKAEKASERKKVFQGKAKHFKKKG